MTAFVAYLKLQVLLLRVRLLPRFMLLAVILAAVVPVLLTNAEPGDGFRVLANSADLVVTTIIILATVMASVALSGDAASGALRAVMMRPISRSAIIMGQALTMTAVTAFLYGIGMVTAYVLCGEVIGYSSVTHQGYEMIGRDAMLEYAHSLLWLPLPAILCAPLIAILISATMDDVALSVVIALGIVMGPYFFGALIEDNPSWLFTEQASQPIRILRHLAEGIEVELRDLKQGTIAYDATTIPALYITVSLGAALALFNLKDCKS